jgi:hypothetical protein
MELIEAGMIAIDFEDNDWTWTFKDGPRVPTAEEILDCVDRMRTTLVESDEDELQIEVGRLLMKKADGHYDLYVYHSEV